MLQEMKRELAFHQDMELIYKQADDNSELQVKQVKELLADGIDLLLISPNEIEPLTAIVEEVYEKESKQRFSLEEKVKDQKEVFLIR